VRETAKAEREKAVILVEARQAAEQNAIEVTVAVDAEKRAALDHAEAIKTQADAEAEAEKIRAEAQRIKNQVEAEGKRIINEALNLLSIDQIAMQVKMELIRQLPEIIRESVKPMERIEGIKIVQWNGLEANGANGEHVVPGGGSLSDQLVNSALRYRAQAPLVDSLLKELGMKADDINGITAPANGQAGPQTN
jgi:uncharacterized membrane protein YqiK